MEERLDGLGANLELYSEETATCVEKHIETWFGKSEKVFHELVSPDIHVDIEVIPPEPERNFYTLVTVGMGAHRMNVGEVLADEQLDRAELVMCLPPDWQVFSSEAQWYWPIKWMKELARFPIEYDTWLGFSHTVDAQKRLDKSVKFSALMLLIPGLFDDEADECSLPSGDVVNFYQVVPLYKEEMNFKLKYGVEALLKRMDEHDLGVLNVKRPKCVNIFGR